MSKNLLQKLNENYNDNNLEELDKHIDKKQSTKSFRMIEKHTGPTEVKVTDKSMKKLAKVVLDL